MILSPSLLACDPGKIAEQMALAEAGGAGRWHLDIMDGHFVDNLSYGANVCSGLAAHTSMPIDAHLMVSDPAKHIVPFINAGAASVTIHIETGDDGYISGLLQKIRSYDVLSGISLNPSTPVERLASVLPFADIALLMSVVPGKGGQSFLPGSLKRLARLRMLADSVNPSCQLQIDGGITLENASDSINAGADVLIAGSSVFGVSDITKRCREFLQRCFKDVTKPSSYL